MSSITVSVDWAKNLCAWNYPQRDSHFAWVQTLGQEQWLLLPYSPEKEDLYQDNFVVRAAPTAEEILRRLPELLMKDEHAFWITIDCHGGHYGVAYNDYQGQKHAGTCVAVDQSPANAAAAMWVFLNQNNLLHDA